MNTNYVGPLGPAGYQGLGVGNNDTTFKEATVGGKSGVAFVGPDRSQGETPGVGSDPCSGGSTGWGARSGPPRRPTRSASPSAMSPIPVVTSGNRATGRIRLLVFQTVDKL